MVFTIRVKSLEQRGLECRLGVMTQSPAENQDLVVQVLCEEISAIAAKRINLRARLWYIQFSKSQFILHKDY